MSWQLIDTYPREFEPGAETYWGQNALFFVPAGAQAPASDYRIICGRLEADMWLGYDDEGSMFDLQGMPSHWMPLPNAP
jgi:hypothetical protein